MQDVSFWFIRQTSPFLESRLRLSQLVKEVFRVGHGRPGRGVRDRRFAQAGTVTSDWHHGMTTGLGNMTGRSAWPSPTTR